jgi:hypothetical protein
MAHTALNDDEIKEYFDTPGKMVRYSRDVFDVIVSVEELDKKIKTLAQFIRDSKHFIVYTGAGQLCIFLVERVMHQKETYHRHIDIRRYQRFSRAIRCVDCSSERDRATAANRSQSRTNSDAHGLRRVDAQQLLEIPGFPKL